MSVKGNDEEHRISDLLYLSDPAIDARLQLVQEARVLHFIPEVCDFRLLSALVALLGHVGDDGVDEQADLRDLDVLLQVQ